MAIFFFFETLIVIVAARVGLVRGRNFRPFCSKTNGSRDTANFGHGKAGHLLALWPLSAKPKLSYHIARFFLLATFHMSLVVISRHKSRTIYVTVAISLSFDTLFIAESNGTVIIHLACQTVELYANPI